MLDTILGHLIAFIEHVITAMGPLGISLFDGDRVLQHSSAE